MLKLKVEPCQGHSDCLYVMVARPYWCDCEVMDNLPNIYDGEDEDEEAESLHHGNDLFSDYLTRLPPLTVCFANPLMFHKH